MRPTSSVFILTTIIIMSAYEEPDWAQQEPSSDCQWHLLEAKGGVELAKHALHRAKRCHRRAIMH
jgi:hypothetical protein